MSQSSDTRSVGRAIGLRVLALHAWLYEHSDGRVGHRLIGLPTLLLRTTGRRSGLTRTNALIYVSDGDRYVVVASAGGADRPPGWLLNLQGDPSVEIQIGRRRQAAVAEVVAPDDADFERLWSMADANNRGRYTSYQARTARKIPVVVLSPSPATNPDRRSHLAG
jgi:deazaflavin-dependent oxidoreductase (nitroreductase family)